MKEALSIARTLADLLAVVVKAIQDGKPERVEHIVPSELRISLERRLAEEKARGKFTSPAPLPEDPTHQ